MKPAIIVMTKAPRSGAVKTRLVPPLTEEEAAALAASFIQDTVALATRVARAPISNLGCGRPLGMGAPISCLALPPSPAPARVIVAYSPPGDWHLIQPLVPRHVLRMAQQGADLGRRQETAIARAAALGLGPVLVVGTDSPTLPPSHLATAIQTLEQGSADVVLGPTPDGGYCLLGLQGPVPGLLAGIAWSTSEVAQQLAENAARMRLRCIEQPPWYDVDTPADLHRLWRELLECPASRRRAPATFRWLNAGALHAQRAPGLSD